MCMQRKAYQHEQPSTDLEPYKELYKLFNYRRSFQHCLPSAMRQKSTENMGNFWCQGSYHSFLEVASAIKVFWSREVCWAKWQNWCQQVLPQDTLLPLLALMGQTPFCSHANGFLYMRLHRQCIMPALERLQEWWGTQSHQTASGQHTQEAVQSAAEQKNTENTPSLASRQDTSWGKD